MRFVSLEGQRFGRWTVKEYKGDKHYLCVCDCGAEGIRQAGALRGGTSKSCGCLQKELIAERNRKHGMTVRGQRHPAWNSWDGMRRRCEDPERRFYNGKGIKVCDQWQTFEAFWVDMGPTWRPGLSIDRIDSDGDYRPDNCRWATKKQQSNNRSSCVIIDTPKGPMNITQAAEEYGLNRWTIASRLRYGWRGSELLAPLSGKRKS